MRMSVNSPAEKKGTKGVRVRTVLFTVFLVSGVVLAGAAVGEGASPRSKGRLAGSNRVETAVAVSQHTFPEGAKTAYLATIEGASDGVVAGTLTDGPVLLVPKCPPVPQAVLDEIERLRPDTVLAVGGPVAVSDGVLEQARSGAPAASEDCTAGGLELRVVDRAPDGSYVDIMLVNNTSEAVVYGREFELARGTPTDFQPLEPPVGPFPADRLVLEAGAESSPIRIGPTVVLDGQSTPLEAGRYRLTHTVEGVPLVVEFSIG